MNRGTIQKILEYTIMGIGIVLIGILLIPLGISAILILAIWTFMDNLLRSTDKIERK